MLLQVWEKRETKNNETSNHVTKRTDHFSTGHHKVHTNHAELERMGASSDVFGGNITSASVYLLDAELANCTNCNRGGER